MSEFIVSARKYRPATFDTVVGQLSITTTLKNSIQNDHLAQAYLFCGPRGVGKTTCARIYAKTINCQNLTSDVEACNECTSCKGFNESSSYNIHELDAASNNSVEDIRNLIDQVRIPPQIGKYSIYIIDEVHMLSTAAFNAFLKTLEEPPKHAIFILATTEKHKILPTILSRCQIFDFNRIKVEDAAGHLASVAEKESIAAEPEALNVIALKADGAMRDALSIFDQVVSFCGNSITYKGVIDNLNILDYDYFFRLTDFFLAEDYKSSLLLFDEVLDKGFDGHNFINGLSEHFRDLLVSKDAATIELLEVGAAIRDKYKEQAQVCTVDFLMKSLDLANKFDLNYRASKNKRLHVELALLQFCSVLKKKDETVAQPAKQSKPAAVSNAPATSAPAPAKPKIPASPSFKDMIGGKAKPAIQPESAPQQSVGGDKTDNTEPDQDKKTKDEIAAPDLSQVDTVAVWKEFVNSIRNTKPRLYGTFAQEEPIIDNNTLVFPVQSQDLIESANSVKSDIVQFYKRKCGFVVPFQFVLSRSAQNKPSTAADKYSFLKEKNSNLDVLRDTFNLDI